jgi:hypothetical protein
MSQAYSNVQCYYNMGKVPVPIKVGVNTFIIVDYNNSRDFIISINSIYLIINGP